MILTYISNYKYEKIVTKSILIENIKKIENAIAISFRKEIFYKKIEIEIEIDLLRLYEKDIKVENIIIEYKLYLKEINKFIKEIILEILKTYKYKYIEFINIDEIYNLKYIFKTFPTIFNKINKLGLKENRLKIVKGNIGFIKEVIQGSDYGYKCKNEECFDRSIIFSFNGYSFRIKNNKEFEKINFIKKIKRCKTCQMKLESLYCKMNKIYDHMICFEGFWIRFNFNKKIEIGKGVIIGLTKIEKNKGRYLEGIMVYNYKKKEIKKRYKMKEEILEKGIKNMTSFYMGYKRNIEINDCILFIILNIFNIRISEGILDSPESDNLKETEENKCEWKKSEEYSNIKWKKDKLIKQNKYEEFNYISTKKNINEEIKMIIYTNDVYYIKKIAKHLINVPIIYSMKAFNNQLSFLCIRSLDDKEKLKKNIIVDYAFCINVNGLIEENYEKNIFYKVKSNEIILEKKIILSIKDSYLFFRKKLKGNIKPEILFNTTEAIVLSIFHLIGTHFSKNEVTEFLKQNFTDKITQLEK